MKTLVGLELSDEAAACLADNQIDLYAELRREFNRDGATIERGTWPVQITQHDREKSTELVLLLSGVTTVMVATAISRIIDAISRYKAVLNDKPVIPPSETNIKLSKLEISLKG
jgi:hypothetical protein